MYYRYDKDIYFNLNMNDGGGSKFKVDSTFCSNQFNNVPYGPGWNLLVLNMDYNSITDISSSYMYLANAEGTHEDSRTSCAGSLPDMFSAVALEDVDLLIGARIDTSDNEPYDNF
jgi:hypothetical protein